MKHETLIYRMHGAFSFLAGRRVQGEAVPMRKDARAYGWEKAILHALLILAWGSQAQAVVNVYFSTAAPASLQSEFIANTTNQYLSTLKLSPYFANTYSLTIYGENPNYQPPAVSSPILDATAFDRCFVYGFADGMDLERKDDLALIDGLRDVLLTSSTCGGFIARSTETHTAFLDGCDTAYMVIKSTISQRDNAYPIVIVAP